MIFNAPIITFQDSINPASVIGGLMYYQSTLGSNFLPVLQGENSLLVKFRVYNNYGLATAIANAFNVQVTVWDGIGAGSHTSVASVAKQCWVRVYETGFGENSTPPGRYTAWAGSDTGIGGTNVYFPEVGSDGLYSDQIRAGSDNNSVGFIEFGSYASVPAGAATHQWNFAMSIAYEWAD